MRAIGKLCLDRFVLSLGGVVLAATLVPCTGISAQVFRALGMLAISVLFFLQGARLPRSAVLNGLRHWRLHAVTASTTFLLFPLFGLSLEALLPHALPKLLWTGVLFACVLPSTVQSSIALTSIAGGNVAAAVCSATASNVAGFLLTPLLFAAMSQAHGSRVHLAGLGQIILQLLVPFVSGHLLRPWIGTWAERNRPMLSITDRSSILLVVYTAFSSAVVHGIWHQVPFATMVALGAVVTMLLTAALSVAVMSSRTLRLQREDEAAVMFCASQKSLVSGVPIANVLFSGPSIGTLLLPIMLYYPLQLLVCAWLARRYGSLAAMPVIQPRPVVCPAGVAGPPA